ncbi:Tn3 family transposase [Listeria newyorkensis]|uniref:Tn3 family transposase n=3 Tax=Listeria newyorkensis TaxID=1497681 RepID=A0ABX4XR90_9LIST|nr:MULTISPECIES: Tn3 family transposase [Listeria]KMT63342.1 transposase Tn3 family protein [Listeria newyorkensis]PNP94293.1 Tn3 family transposase [Listeria newyorkensis]RQW67750.1 Tn3 family transposase [Listeria sp. SHR_NRA_18]WAO22707.1 Tn3 family transposase [Listeria newyorkensis]SQC51721.1 Transposase and inactivated derivatives, TnpA family [Listeria newyorkensis]
MKKEWTIDEEIEAFILSDREMAFVTTKYRATRIGFAVMLKYFQLEHQFPVEKNDVPPDMPAFIAKQLQLSSDAYITYQLDSKTAYRQRQEILQFCGFREENEADRKSLQDWLDDKIYEYNQDVDVLKEQLSRKYRVEKIIIPSESQIETLVRGCIRQKEQQFYQTTYQRLSATSLEKMAALLAYWGALENEENDKEDITKITFRRLTLGPGRLSQATLVMELNKLQTLLDLELPDYLFTDIPAKILQKYRLRATSEDKTEVSRHNDPIRYTLLSAFFWLKIRELHDSLVELLITLIHKIDGRAEKKVKMELILEVKKVFGKNKILVHLLESALQNPNGIIKDTLFSVASPEIVGDIVKELKYKNSIYQEKVHWRIRNSYSSSYRSAVTNILQTLQFKSNNHRYQPVIQAIDLLRQYHTSKQITFSPSEDIPLGPEIIPKKWYDLVIKEDSNGELKINRINYEICVLHALKDKLKCREIWVSFAFRYRNPDEYLPADFEEKRVQHYETLQLPLDGAEKIESLQLELRDKLHLLDTTMPDNKKVNILTKKNGWIAVAPNELSPDPHQLTYLKKEITDRWWMTNLIDIIKETDLRTGFSTTFQSLATYERLDREAIQKRLLLCLYGIGTNTGIRRVSSGSPDISYKDLLYVKRKYIHTENLKAANQKIVNAILTERAESVWGKGSTSCACASDSSRVVAYDQNLRTQWFPRYRGPGVSVYWHIEEKSMCIHSQVNAPNSSEVAAMLHGLLHHGTAKEVDRNYVDTHGQSAVGFAFCHLLGYELLPRFKNIHAQKLYRASASDRYEHIAPVIAKRAINWDLIHRQYNEMVKYATALRIHTADTEAILKQFSKNSSHPTYLAFQELGKVIKTMFLCDYLLSEELRKEIHAGLNTVGNWHSASDFVFFGQGGEIRHNQLEEQEIAMLSLQLIQNCMIYMNTLKIQSVLSKKEWQNKMEAEDYRALTPMIYNHINPYGEFHIDMKKRIHL